ncbi:MAG: JAB domain-containing protein [Dehalococcoidia bacterium]|nr:MAG: JAB domain-containing protein [Dehalococcoidia bacterium]
MVEYHLRINELPASERPRERLKESGPASLSNSELLAIILRTGTAAENVLGLASRLLSRFGGLVGLARASLGELCAERGVGQAKAAQLKAALELGRRLSSTHPEERAVVRTPQDVANLLMAEMSFLDQEQLRVVLLTSKNQVISIPDVYKGNVNTSLIRPSELFREAVRENCPAIIVVHNHPSGDPDPSPEDIAVTEQIVAAGRVLDIEVLDHMIIGGQRYVSLKERGVGIK